jgi:hypothetical protein
LIALREATVINTNGADEFLSDLVERVDRLDRVGIRRRRPRPLSGYTYLPQQSSSPQGWGALPLLQLRGVVVIGEATIDSTGMILPEHRDRIVETLGAAALTQRLRRLSTDSPAPALADPTQAAPAPLEDWGPTPGGFQSTELATYRLGGDATSGVAAMAQITMPRQSQGAVILITIDVAVSLGRPLTLVEAAVILRDALVLTSGGLYESIADLIPPDAGIAEAEVHIVAMPYDGQGKTRKNNVGDRVALSQLGEPSRESISSMSFAAGLSEPLTERDGAELVLQAIEIMALRNGFLDPRTGLAKLRAELGLLPEALPS